MWHIIPWLNTHTWHVCQIGIILSKDKKAVGQTWSCVKTLRSNVNTVSRWMYATHISWWWSIDPCAKYMPMSKETKVRGWTSSHVLKKTINLTSRSKIKVILKSWICTTHISWWYTHVPNVVCQCQSKKKLRAR